MAEDREPKRVRQACQNCRRKKTRCSGEKPICAFCARLKQECTWDDLPPPAGYYLQDPSSAFANEATLAARVALLESKLSLLGAPSVDALLFDSSSKRRRTSSFDDGDTDRSGDRSTSPEQQTGLMSKFSVLPPPDVLHSILKTYFARCHNQPYTYFRPSYFFSRLEAGTLPKYLLIAMVALTARFCDDAFFEFRQTEAAERFARTAWKDIFDNSFTEDYVLDVHAVQATNMLAVVEFTGGRPKLGWQKIGLAVRFAQSLELGTESQVALSPEERDERHLTFWSMYLLDRLVSCSSHRTPSFVDRDCAIPLPLDAPLSDTDDALALPGIRTWSEASRDWKLPHFAQLTLMASALGRVERHVLQYRKSNDSYPPWDSRSDFAAIYSFLLNFEAHSEITSVPLTYSIDQFILPDGTPDDAAAGHLILATVLYHMNQCVLHHPFLLRRRLEAFNGRVSLSFLRDALRRSLEHAYQLTIALRAVLKRGFSLTSFYSYAIMVAGTIHKLFTYHDDEWSRKTAEQLSEYSIEFLEAGRGLWKNYPRIATALRSFDPDPASAKALVTANTVEQAPLNASLEIMWKLLDYGWLSESARPTSLDPQEASNPPPTGSPQPAPDWPPFQLDSPSAVLPATEGPGLMIPPQPPGTVAVDAVSSHATDHPEFPVMQEFGVDETVAFQDQMSLDFTTYHHATGSSWSQVLDGGDIFFSSGLGSPSRWTHQEDSG